MLYLAHMDDILPMMLVFSGLISAILFGLILYALSVFVGFPTALFLVLSGFSLLAGGIIYLLVPGIDNKDAIKVIRQIIIFVIIANVLVILGNLIKIFAIKF